MTTEELVDNCYLEIWENATVTSYHHAQVEIKKSILKAMESFASQPEGSGGEQEEIEESAMTRDEIWRKWQSDKKQLLRLMKALTLLGIKNDNDLKNLESSPPKPEGREEIDTIMSKYETQLIRVWQNEHHLCDLTNVLHLAINEVSNLPPSKEQPAGVEKEEFDEEARWIQLGKDAEKYLQEQSKGMKSGEHYQWEDVLSIMINFSELQMAKISPTTKNK